MKPRVFISSTFYDLRQIRDDIDRFIENLGYESVRHDKGDVPYGNKEALEKYCYEEIEKCDMVISIIGGRFGVESTYEKEVSISQMELKVARKTNKQVYICIDKNVDIEFGTYLINKKNEWTPKNVDDKKIFAFIEEVKNLKLNNPITTFEYSNDIETFLKKQFAGLFQKLLSNQSQEAGADKELNTIFIPLKKQKTSRDCKKIIEEAPDNTEVCFISVTACNDLLVTVDYENDLEHFQKASERGISFKGVVFNPEGIEAKFRSAIETPDSDIKDTLLYKDSKKVIESLNHIFWKKKKIEMKYARVGLQFKLWLSEKEVLIEPYHFGKDKKKQIGGLCKFSRILYQNDTEEYRILKNHFNQLWEKSDSFWPNKNTSNILFSRVEIEVNTDCNKKNDQGNYCSFCPNAKIDPINPRKVMEEKLYHKIIDELKELNFEGRISFHFYGEPLMHPNIVAVINYASENLPKAERVIYTNGDKLNDDNYNELIKAGISKIVVSNLEGKNIKTRDKQIILTNIHHNNKGGILGKISTLNIPCYAPTHRLIISYDGNVLLCYEDAGRKNKMGKVKDNKIVDIWQSEKFRKIRQELVEGKRENYDLCKNCDNQSHIEFGQAYVNYF